LIRCQATPVRAERKIVARAVPDVAMAADDLELEPCLVRRECFGGEAVQFRGTSEPLSISHTAA
jgi:hypothetical protein